MEQYNTPNYLVHILILKKSFYQSDLFLSLEIEDRSSTVYFCVGFFTLCQGPQNLFLYLFICPRERSACHVVFIWRAVSREDWIPIGVFSQWIAQRSFLFPVVVLENLYGISSLSTGDFCFQGKDKSFLFLRVLCVL